MSDCPECKDIALLRGDSVFQAGGGGFQQFGWKVSEVTTEGKSVVYEAGVEIVVDEDVRLCGMVSER